MRIGQLAEATGTTIRALRHYEQHGLLASARPSSGYRDHPGNGPRQDRIDALIAVHDELAARPA